MRGFVLLFTFLSAFCLAQTGSICVLDLTKKNAETTSGNLFSLEHLLRSGGFSYTVTDSVDLAIKNQVILSTSNFETTTFNSKERDSIKQYIRKGGILIATNNKEPLLDSIFGISATSFNYNRFYLNFKTQYDAVIFKLFDDNWEKQIRFGDTSDYSTCIGTRAFTCNTADTLAMYETNEVAATHNKFYAGHTYMLGTQYKEVILRPQMKQDFGAARDYSNNFEPAQDVYVFFIAGILKKHQKYIVNKHTAPCNFKSSLILTHDVDATTSMDFFDDHANYEIQNNIRSTYMITTHYVHDELAKNFFDGYENDILGVSHMGHDIQSHSVSHVPDFDIESVVPMGAAGNTRTTYQPYYNGAVSSNVTVFGEAEVSRNLLQSITGKNVSFFRPGYLAFHDKLVNVLDSLNYPFSSSHSANDVMTHFPFFQHTDLSMNGRLTNLLEIPNTISDIFSGDPMTEQNFNSKVDEWKTVFTKCHNNSTNTVLLIHPTRYYKLFAQQQFVSFLPQDVVVTNLSDFGNYWLNRNDVEVTTTINNDTMTIFLSKPKDQINSWLSFVVNNGQDFSKLKVYSSDMQLIPFTKNYWGTNDVILHNACARPNYNVYSITEQPELKNVYVYPNPSDKDHGWLHFELMEETLIEADIVDMRGALVNKLIPLQSFNIGMYNINLPTTVLAEGAYNIRLKIADNNYKLKWVLSKSK